MILTIQEYKAMSVKEFICTNSFHHYPNPQAFMTEASRVLKMAEG